ncbi:MAG: NADH-quinone oxidoreductase subunit J [Nitrospirae bacterium]|nr:NADH-quinone oxidoreductase subunit J [Nitrospirota bacterium]
MQMAMFGYFGAAIVISALFVVYFRNPIYSAMSLLTMFMHIAGLYVLLEAEFLAGVQLLVYAGAILVLYLFVVMLLNVQGRGRFLQKQTPAVFALGILAAIEVAALIFHTRFYPELPAIPHPGVPNLGNTETIGMVLYTQYLFPFEIASLVLLIALVGAIVLAKGKLKFR